MVLSATLPNPYVFKQLVATLRDLVKEVCFECNESGLQMQTMDSSNVAMVHMKMKDSCFEKYQCDENCTIGLTMDKIGRAMRMCGPEDRIHLKMGGDNVPENYIRFEFENPENCRVSVADLRTIVVPEEPVGVPSDEYDLVMTLPSHDMKKAMGDLKEFGDTLRIVATNEGVKFSAEGDIGAGNQQLKIRNGGKLENTFSIEGDAEIDMGFGMRYMALFTRASGLSTNCVLRLKQNEPFRLTYFLGEEAHGCVEFLLASKVD